MAPAGWRPPSGEAQLVIQALGLVPHPEGGFFRETFRSGTAPMVSKGATVEVDDRDALIATSRSRSEGDTGNRNILTSIYWMLTAEDQCGCWIDNLSTHIHYHHGGGPIRYHIVDPVTGRYETRLLEPPTCAGAEPQLVVPGGVWKVSRLEDGAEYALIGEAVAPGFDARDLVLVTAEMLRGASPEAFEAAGALLHERLKAGSTKTWVDHYD